MNLIKITRIKKGLNFQKLENQKEELNPAISLQVIKCPKCA